MSPKLAGLVPKVLKRSSTTTSPLNPPLLRKYTLKKLQDLMTVIHIDALSDLDRRIEELDRYVLLSTVSVT